MNWFLLAIPPAMWAISNHIDKYLLSKYFKEVNIPVLAIFSSLIGIPIALVIALMSPDVFSIDLWRKLLLVANGAFYIIGFIPYYKALEKDDASVVVPLYQTIPIFVYFLGLFFLGEVLTVEQILASGLIMLGAVGISLDLESEKLRIKKQVLLLMLLASFLVALNIFFYKYAALDENFWTSIFWNDVGMIVFGFVLLSIPKYKKQFFKLLRENKLKILTINAANEVVNIIGDIVFRFVSLLAPLALVQVASNGLQPVFVLLYGLLLTAFFPHIAKENLSKKSLVQKSVAFSILFAGTYLLNIAS